MAVGEQPATGVPLRNDLERGAYQYYDNKRDDVLNLDLGHLDGFYHHHFAVGDFDRSVLDVPPAERERRMAAELHRMETEQVRAILECLDGVGPAHRVLDAGSGRGGTAFLLNRATGCAVDGVNLSPYQNSFAREQAERHGCGVRVRFHERNMVDTGFPAASFDCVVSNETTMYVDLREAFAEFARVLVPGGRYVLLTWCVNDARRRAPDEAAAIDRHYACRTHCRSSYLKALLGAGLVPFRVDDLTEAAIPYWELRRESELATGIEDVYLNGYRSDRVNYIRIVSRRAAP